MRCLPVWAWGRNVSMWPRAQAGDYVISVRHSDHEETGLWKWSLQLEWSGMAQMWERGSWAAIRVWLWWHEHGLGFRYLKQLHSFLLLAAVLFSFGSQAIKNSGFLEEIGPMWIWPEKAGLASEMLMLLRICYQQGQRILWQPAKKTHENLMEQQM